MEKRYSPRQSSCLLGPRVIASTAYDTAWVANVPDPADPCRPRFPAALEWLIAQQHPDGSWGGAINYQHDRILSTLAALLHSPVSTSMRLHIAPFSAHRPISGNMPMSSITNFVELAAFELLLPMLIGQVTEVGIHLPAYLDIYTAERRQKLALIPPDLLYSNTTPLVHSLEFLGSEVDVGRLLIAQNEHGALGNSPSTTAYLLQWIDNPAAVRYLQLCLASDGGAAVPVTHPIELFDFLWSAYNRWLGGVPIQQLLPAPLCAILLHALQQDSGISMSTTFPLIDADNTAIGLLLLAARQHHVSFAVLDQFEQPGWFISFAYERNPSPSANAHILDALKWMPPGPARDTKMIKILHYLEQARINRTYWTDKWHISPYYATSHSIIACERLDLPAPYAQLAVELASTAMDWILHTQRPRRFLGLL